MIVGKEEMPKPKESVEPIIQVLNLNVKKFRRVAKGKSAKVNAFQLVTRSYCTDNVGLSKEKLMEHSSPG